MSLIKWFKGTPDNELYTVSDVTDTTKQTGPMPVNVASVTGGAGVGLTSVNVIIADSASLSAEGDLTAGLSLVGVILPAGWDTNVMSFAAALTTGGTFLPVYSAAGAEVVTGSLVASTWVALDPADFAGMRFIKVRSGTSAAAVNQSGAVTITLVARTV